MAISKIILNGVTQMDVTGKTVTAGDMLNGVTALKNDGTDIAGNISNMTLPSASSSTASGTSKATITPGASAQYLNIPVGYLSTAQYYTIAAASGGASNIVTGTFKGTTTGAAMDVTLNYSGSGYPIALVIYPKEGSYNPNGTFYSTVKRYALTTYFATLNVPASAPEYGSSSSATTRYFYKSSGSTASSVTSSGSNSSNQVFVNSNASSSNYVRIRSSTKMSVFIASNSYGFAANVEYTYHVIYSS